MEFDAIVVGGGPAGLSAALVLGRCRRRVLVCDAGHPRNEASGGVHGFFTRDCEKPEELRRIGREQLAPYAVEFRSVGVKSISRDGRGFEVKLAKGGKVRGRKVLIATGVRDVVPDIPGFREMFGKSVHHCPYCDGWEWRDQPVGVYARRQKGFGLALSLRTAWTGDVAIFSDGGAGLSSVQRAELKRFDIAVYESRVLRLEGKDGMLARVVLADGSSVERRAIFLNTGFTQQCGLAKDLGCIFTDKGVVKTG